MSRLPSHQKYVLLSKPAAPWHCIHLDFVGVVNGLSYLVLVDLHSKWAEVVPLKYSTITTLMDSLCHIFSTHRLPGTIVTDNGAQFSSTLFQNLLKSQYHSRLLFTMSSLIKWSIRWHLEASTLEVTFVGNNEWYYRHIPFNVLNDAKSSVKIS